MHGEQNIKDIQELRKEVTGSVFLVQVMKAYGRVELRYHAFLTLAIDWMTDQRHAPGACGGAVGRGTAIQAGRSRVRFPMVSLEFFVDIILPAALWP